MSSPRGPVRVSSSRCSGPACWPAPARTSRRRPRRLRPRCSSPRSSGETCQSRWNWSARREVSRTSRSEPVSRATSMSSASRKARSCVEGRCSTASTASRSRRRWPTCRPNWPRRRRGYEKTQNDVKRLQPLAAKQAVSAQELDNALAAQDAARAQVEARKADMEKRVARPGLHQRDLADRRPRRHHPGQGGQPGRARREHAAHDRVADRPDSLPRRHQRSRVPAHRAARRRAARGPRRCEGARSTWCWPTAPSTPRRATWTRSSGPSMPPRAR